MPELTDLTPLAIVALIIVLTDRWVARFYREYKEHLERQELLHNQQIGILLKCADELAAIKESFRINDAE